MSYSEHQAAADLAQVTADAPHTPPPRQQIPSSPVRLHSHSSDSDVHAELAAARQEREDDRVEHQAAMARLLELQQQVMARLAALDARPADLGVDSAFTVPIAVPLPATYLQGINPALLASPATVRQPPLSVSGATSTYPTSHSSAARGLFANLSTAAQPPLPPRPNNEEEKGWDKWMLEARKTIKIEPFRGGSQDERKNIRTWVTSLSMQLELIAGPRRDDNTVNTDRQQQEQARVATTYLQDSALDWAVMYRLRCVAAGQPVRWDQLSFALMAKYEGQDHALLRRQELQNLTYKRGRCADLPKYEAEFDRLALLVHGSALQNPTVDELLGQMFANGIQRGDAELYASMIPVGTDMPVTLQQWKGRAEQAIVRTQTLKLGSSTTRPSGSSGQAALHNTEADEEHKSSTVGQLVQAPTPSGADLATEIAKLLAVMQTYKPKAKQHFNKGAASKKYQLAQDERTKLFAARRCFCCYKVGHRAGDCSQKATLPNRAPTADELKA